MSNTKMTSVRFKPTQLLDPVKQGGTMKVGKTFKGKMEKRKDGSKVVYFEDKNNQGWTFWEGITCKIVKDGTHN